MAITKYNAEIFNARETTTPTPVAGGVYIYSKSDGKLYFISSTTAETEIGSGGSGTQEIFEYADLSSFPATGAVETLYIALDTRKLYRWDGTSAYEELSPDTTVLNVVFVDEEADLPLTGVVDTLYIAKAEATQWIWDGVQFVQCGGGDSEAEVYFYDDLAGFPATGSDLFLYVAKDTNKIYRWNGVDAYVEISQGGGLSSLSVPWQPSYAYEVGDLVEYKNILFKISSQHTSVAGFDLSKVTPLNENCEIITLGTFADLDVVYFDGTDWQKAIATAEATLSQPQRFVYFNDGTLALLAGQGKWTMTAHTLTLGINYLSDTVAGTTTTTEPTEYSNAIFNAIDTNTIICLDWEAIRYVAGGGGGIEEAPEDGETYGRKDATWLEVVPKNSYLWGANHGVITLPTLTDNTVGSIGLSGTGVAQFFEDVAGKTTTFRVTIDAQTPIFLTDNTVNYIYADYNGGTPVYAVTLSPSDFLVSAQKVPMYRIVRTGTILHVLDYDEYGSDVGSKILYKDIAVRSFERMSGLILSTSGTRIATVSAGTAWFGVKMYTLAENVSGTTGILAEYYLSGGTWLSSLVNEYDSVYYSDGTDRLTLDNSKYVAKYFFRGIENQNHVYMVHGNQQNSLELARAELVPALPSVISGHALYVGKIVVQKSATIGTAFPRVWEGSVQSATGAVQWGDIAGTLSNQADLQSTLNGKADTSHSHTIAWTAGTTAGPTLSVAGGTAVAIPSASATASGIVTTGAQDFAGTKTFTNTIEYKNGTAFKFSFAGTPTANRTITMPDASGTLLMSGVTVQQVLNSDLSISKAVGETSRVLYIKNTSYDGNSSVGYCGLELGFSGHGVETIRVSKVTTNTSQITLYNESGYSTPVTAAIFNPSYCLLKNVYERVVTTARAVQVESDGKLGYISSVRRTKNKIDYNLDTSFLYDLKPVSFEYRLRNEAGEWLEETDGHQKIGLIAEDVDLVKPEMTYKSTEGVLEGVDYQYLIPALLIEIQNLNARLKVLEEGLL